MDLTKEELNEMLSAFKSEITETFSTQTKEILTQVDKKNGGTAAALTKEFQKATESLKNQVFNGGNDSTLEPDTAPKPDVSPKPDASGGSSDKLSLKALQNQIETLRQERETQAQQLLQEKRNSTLNTLFSGKKAQFPDKATRAFLMENESNIKHEDGNWYVADGDNVKPISDAVDSFLTTDFGQTFQPASKGRGMNMKKVMGEQSAGKSDSITLNDSLLMPDSE